MLLRTARSCSSYYRMRLKIAQMSVSCVDTTECENSIDIPWQRFLLEVTYNGSKYHGAIATGEYPSVKSAIQVTPKYETTLIAGHSTCHNLNGMSWSEKLLNSCCTVDKHLGCLWQISGRKKCKVSQRIKPH